MANNVAVTAGTGTTIATDEVVDATLGTVQVQYMKLMDGTNDGTNRVQVGPSGGMSVKGASLAGTSASIAAAGTGTIGPLAVGDGGNVTFTVKNTTAATAFAGAPVIVFEQSDDNVSWAPLNVVRASDNYAASTFTVAPVGANGAMMFDAAAEGVNWVRARVTTGPTTSPLTVAITSGGMPFSPVVSTVSRQDASRSARTITLNGGDITAAADTLLTMSYSADNAAPTTGTSYNVTPGKRLRVTSITLGLNTITGNNAATFVSVRVRVNATGAAVLNSPLEFVAVIPGQAAVNAASFVSVAIPDGWEVPGGAGIAFTAACPGYVASTAAPKLSISVTAFEY